MNDNLPKWYPLANATYEDVDGWLTAKTPSFERMKAALPWLKTDRQLLCWLDGARSARSEPLSPEQVECMFPGLADIPLPPRRRADSSKR